MKRWARAAAAAGEMWRNHRYTLLAFTCCVMQLMCVMTLKTTMVLFVGEIGLSTFIAGLLSAVMVACSVMVKPLVGVLLDRRGFRLCMTIAGGAGLIAVCAQFVSLSARSALLATLAALLTGIAYSALSVSEIPLFLNQSMGPSQDSYMINLVGFNTVLCTAIAPTLSQAVLARWGFGALYAGLIALGGAGLALLGRAFARLRPPKACPAGAAARGIKAADLLAICKNKRFALLFISYMTWGISNGTILFFLNAYGASVGASTAVFFTLYSAVNIAFRWFVPACLNRFGNRTVLLLAFVCLTAGSILLGWFTSAQRLILPAILSGLGTSALYAPIVGQAMQCLPSHLKMSGLGVFLIAFEVGQGIASLLIGACAASMTYGQMFAMIGLIQGAGIFTIMAATRPHTERSISHHEV